MKKRIPLLPKIVLLYFVTASLLVTGGALWPTKPEVQSVTVVPRSVRTHIPLIYGEPVRISIPSVGIDLPVNDGRYDTNSNTWELSADKVHYALTSHLPNNKYGNTVLYGHNNPKVLGRTKQIAPYDELIITTKDGRRLKYVYMNDSAVNPSNTEVFSDQAPGSQVTLLTCDGAWNQQRRLMVFEFTEAE